MTEDRFLEIAPLAALGALDGDERTGFESHLPECAVCRAALAENQALLARIPQALDRVAPRPALRSHVLAATRPKLPAPPPRRQRGVAIAPWLAAAAALVLAFVLKVQRDDARRDAVVARADAARSAEDAREARQQLAAASESLSQQRAVTLLVAQSESRVTPLAGQKDAPQARGRMLWSPASRDAVLVVSGLPPAPAGQAYEVWVIGQGAPVPAGLFQASADGSAVFRLPQVAETAQPKTFAVTLETAAGVPAPSGPMVLAGNVS
jgi:anti-sigma-K factor RskA